MNEAYLVVYLIVLGVSVAGNVFQAIRSDRMVRRWLNPPSDFVQEAIVDAASAGHHDDAARIAEGAAKANGDDEFLRTDQAI